MVRRLGRCIRSIHVPPRPAVFTEHGHGIGERRELLRSTRSAAGEHDQGPEGDDEPAHRVLLFNRKAADVSGVPAWPEEPSRPNTVGCSSACYCSTPRDRWGLCLVEVSVSRRRRQLLGSPPCTPLGSSVRIQTLSHRPGLTRCRASAACCRRPVPHPAGPAPPPTRRPTRGTR